MAFTPMDFNPKPIGDVPEKPANAVGFSVQAAAQYLLIGSGAADVGDAYTAWLEIHLQHMEAGTDLLISTSTVTSYGRQTAYAGTTLFLAPGNYALFGRWARSDGQPPLNPEAKVEEPRTIAVNTPFEIKTSNKGAIIQSIFRLGFARPIHAKAWNRVRQTNNGGFVDVVLKATHLKTGAILNETPPQPNYDVGNGKEVVARFAPIMLPVGEDILLEGIPSNLHAAPDFFHMDLSSGPIP